MSDAKKVRDAIKRNAAEYIAKSNIGEEHVYRSRGRIPVTLFRQHHSGTKPAHPNFHPLSYEAILGKNDWSQRLKKPHNAKRALFEKDRESALELDSCCSSDALVMNVFCHPSAATEYAIGNIFKLKKPLQITFGSKPHVPFLGGGRERRSTEIDLTLKSGAKIVICEAKLTEQGFTPKDKTSCQRYRDFATVFKVPALPQTDTHFRHYQLIRNFLAAFHLSAEFVLICDESRRDLMNALSVVRRALNPNIRLKTRVVTWQEIIATLPDDLKSFLNHKYGF